MTNDIDNAYDRADLISDLTYMADTGSRELKQLSQEKYSQYPDIIAAIVKGIDEEKAAFDSEVSNLPEEVGKAYNESETRDDHGRWTSGGSSGGSSRRRHHPVLQEEIDRAKRHGASPAEIKDMIAAQRLEDKKQKALEAHSEEVAKKTRRLALIALGSIAALGILMHGDELAHVAAKHGPKLISAAAKAARRMFTDASIELKNYVVNKEMRHGTGPIYLMNFSKNAPNGMARLRHPICLRIM